MPTAPRPEAAVVEAVEHLGAALNEAGIQRLPARVFAALLADEDGRMTAAEVGAELQVSPAAVSGAVRYLGQIQLVRRERERGSRKDVYVVLDDAWHDLLMQKDQLYAPILTALRAAIRAPGLSERAEERMHLSVEFLEFIQAEMDGVAARWEEHKARRA
jgi:DNA-binding transcriptional regulator GbsR (MarR family)